MNKYSFVVSKAGFRAFNAALENGSYQSSITPQGIADMNALAKEQDGVVTIRFIVADVSGAYTPMALKRAGEEFFKGHGGMAYLHREDAPLYHKEERLSFGDAGCLANVLA